MRTIDKNSLELYARIIEAEAGILPYIGKVAVAQCILDHNFSTSPFTTPAKTYSKESMKAAVDVFENGIRRFENHSIIQFRSYLNYGSESDKSKPDWEKIYSGKWPIPDDLEYLGKDGTGIWGHFYFGRRLKMATWKDIVNAAEELFEERNKYCYFYGAKGQVMTSATMEALWQASPSYFSRYDAIQKKKIFDYSRGKIGLDCSGFVCMCLEKAGIITRGQWTYSVALIGRCNNVTTDVASPKSPAGSLLYTGYHGAGRHIGVDGGEGFFYDIAAEGDTIRRLPIAKWGHWEKAGQYPGVDYSTAFGANEEPARFEMPKGYLDSVSKNKISGWAWDGTKTALDVHIYIHNENNERVALFSTIADEYRADLKEAGIGDGNHAFVTDYDFYSKLGEGTYKVTAFAINENKNGVNPQLTNEHIIKVEKPKYQNWVGKATTTVRVREGAGTDYEILVSYPLLGPGNLVEVIGEAKSKDGGLWYNILIANRYKGFVNSKYLEKV